MAYGHAATMKVDDGKLWRVVAVMHKSGIPSEKLFYRYMVMTTPKLGDVAVTGIYSRYSLGVWKLVVLTVPHSYAEEQVHDAGVLRHVVELNSLKATYIPKLDDNGSQVMLTADQAKFVHEDVNVKHLESFGISVTAKQGKKRGNSGDDDDEPNKQKTAAHAKAGVSQRRLKQEETPPRRSWVVLLLQKQGRRKKRRVKFLSSSRRRKRSRKNWGPVNRSPS
jgi:hypothetical protein